MTTTLPYLPVEIQDYILSIKNEIEHYDDFKDVLYELINRMEFEKEGYDRMCGLQDLPNFICPYTNTIFPRDRDYLISSYYRPNDGGFIRYYLSGKFLMGMPGGPDVPKPMYNGRLIGPRTQPKKRKILSRNPVTRYLVENSNSFIYAK
jgi:hypothetical protein